MRATLCLVGLAFAVPAGAEEAAQDEDLGTICVAIGAPWTGDASDVRAIETTPIPESYRARFESTAPCVRFWLIEDSLIDWHLRFGSEHSVTPALEYLERDYAGDRRPERYLAELKRAADAIRGENRPIQLLEAFVETADDYVSVTTQYLRAAEEFKSRSLLDEAERYLRPVLAGREFMAGLETDPAERADDLDFPTFRTDDLELRAAVLRAQLGATKTAIAQAEAVLNSKERSYYRALAEYAFTGGDDFCDIDPDFRESDAIEAACEADEALQERFVDYLRSRAMLDLLAGDEDPEGWSSNYGLAIRFLSVEQSFGDRRCCQRSSEEDLLRLRLAAAEHYRTVIDARQNHNPQPLFQALGELRAAERLAPPFDAPGRFRRIARAWLDIREQLEAEREPSDRLRDTGRPAEARYAAYLERALADLDSIAQGEGH